jgi:hypothetical protein
MPTRLTKNFISTVSSKVNVVDTIDFLAINQDFEVLKKQLLETKRSFSHNDFYLISHYDPEYYLPECPYGLTTFNFVRTFQEVDISLSRAIIVTNKTGYAKEFEYLIPKEMHQWEMPVVFDDCLSAFKLNFLSNFSFDDCAVNSQEITTNGLSMMRAPRIHRNTLYNYLKENNLLDTIAVAFQNES